MPLPEVIDFRVHDVFNGLGLESVHGKLEAFSQELIVDVFHIRLKGKNPFPPGFAAEVHKLLDDIFRRGI